MANGIEPCGEFSTCPEGLRCDPNSGMCVNCKCDCGDCGEGYYCAAGNMCKEGGDPCADKECDCGDKECDDGLVCEDFKCIEVEMPDVVEQEEVLDEEVIPPPDVKKEDKKPNPCPEGFEYVEGEGGTGGMCKCPEGKVMSAQQTCVCPAGTKPWFDKCVKDDTGGGGDDGGCSFRVTAPQDRSNPGPYLLLLCLALAAFVSVRVQRRE